MCHAISLAKALAVLSGSTIRAARGFTISCELWAKVNFTLSLLGDANSRSAPLLPMITCAAAFEIQNSGPAQKLNGLTAPEKNIISSMFVHVRLAFIFLV